jgi:hypothetical protein
MNCEAVHTWLRATTKQYVELHALAAELLHSDLRDEVFLEVSALLQETVEKVRVLSASPQAGSPAAGEPCTALLAQSTHLMEQCTTLMEHMSQVVPPSA